MTTKTGLLRFGYFLGEMRSNLVDFEAIYGVAIRLPGDTNDNTGEGLVKARKRRGPGSRCGYEP